MKTIQITSKDGQIYAAIDFGDYYSVKIDGAWCYIGLDGTDDPKTWLAANLFRQSHSILTT